MKIYLVYFEWANTKGNHAGMAYLAKALKRDCKEVRLIKMVSGRNKFLKSLNFFYVFFIAIKLRLVLRKGDKVFLMEYLARSCFQDIIAKTLRLLGSRNEILALVHLAGSHLLEIYGSVRPIQQKLKPIDRVVTLGSSLTDFFRIEVGFKNVFTTFHYVEDSYYKPLDDYIRTGDLQVLCIGATKRDFGFLGRLVKDMPSIHFNICQGRHDLTSYFEECGNVTLYGFMPESELLEMMQKNDVNFSVMEDTIGSNVIVGGLSTGMIMVVSDVGSIRDYCTEYESFLCKNEKDFIETLTYLQSHIEEIPSMKQKAFERSLSFTYKKFVEVFRKDICQIV